MVLTIYVDSREPDRVFKRLQYLFPKIKFVKKALDKGDFTAMNLDREGKNKYNEVIVERKAIADLDGSIRSGRLVTQMDALATKPNMVYVLLVVGDLGKFVVETRKQSFRPNAYAETLLRSVAEISASYNCHVLWVTNEDVAFQLMVRLIKLVNAGKYNVPAKRDYNHLCARLLGITYKQWIELKDDGNSLVDIAEMNKAKLLAVRGIGKEKAAGIKRILIDGEK